MTAIETLGLEFSKPRILATKFGERRLFEAPATEEFWTAWRANKDALKKAGLSVRKDDMTGQWSVQRWEETMAAADRAAALAASRAQDAAVEIPVPDGQSLLPYQKAGVAYALARPATLLADDMGLGKTVQAIAVASTTNARRILVICPASLLANWRNEIGRWQTLNLPVKLVRAGTTLDVRPEQWVIINYDILSRYEQIKSIEWDLIVLDECHMLKSSKAKRTQWIMGGGRGEEKVEPIQAKRKLLLTGTPICNRPKEAYTILHYLDPARWATKSAFERRYCAASLTPFGYNANGASRLDELQDRMRATVMVRRLKIDVLTELPPKMRQVVLLDVPAAAAVVDAENAAYDRTAAVVDAAQVALDQARDSGDDAAYQTAVGRLREARGIAFTEMARVRHDTAVAKIPAVITHLDAIEEGKVIIFAHHKAVVSALVAALAPQGVVSITGDTPNEQRQVAVDRFQTDPSVRFFVGNIRAAGVGLTLTASSHVVFAELDWTPGNVTQAEDRCHRLGQRRAVLIQHLVLDGSLDAKMAKTIINKQRVIEQALDDDAPFEYATRAEKPSESPAKPPEPEIVLTDDQVAAIHSALRTVAAFDDDRASAINDMGFSKADTDFGCSLAARDRLTNRQALIGRKIVRKYRRQYPMDLYVRIFGEEWK